MSEINFRRAQESDIPAIVAMPADDPLGRDRQNASVLVAAAGMNLGWSLWKSKPPAESPQAIK